MTNGEFLNLLKGEALNPAHLIITEACVTDLIRRFPVEFRETREKDVWLRFLRLVHSGELNVTVTVRAAAGNILTGED